MFRLLRNPCKRVIYHLRAVITAQLWVLPTVPCGKTGQTAEAGLHHTAFAVDLLSVLQGTVAPSFSPSRYRCTFFRSFKVQLHLLSVLQSRVTVQDRGSKRQLSSSGWQSWNLFYLFVCCCCFFLSYWLKPLTDEGRKETKELGDPPPLPPPAPHQPSAIEMVRF